MAGSLAKPAPILAQPIDLFMLEPLNLVPSGPTTNYTAHILLIVVCPLFFSQGRVIIPCPVVDEASGIGHLSRVTKVRRAAGLAEDIPPGIKAGAGLHCSAVVAYGHGGAQTIVVIIARIRRIGRVA